MTTENYAGVAVETTNDGYLADAGQWTPAIGEAIAAEVGINLTPVHWEVINFAREDYSTTGLSPGLRRIAAQSTVKMKDLYKLFPKGPGKLVAKISGTPKPKSCL